jgi:phosphatidate cytidylyltransferase
MLQRIVVGTGIVIIVVIAIFLSTLPAFMPIFGLLFSLMSALILREFYRLAKFKGHEPLTLLGMATGFAYTLAVFTSTQAELYQLLPYTIVMMSLFFGFCLFMIKGKDPLVNLSVTFFGLLYLAIPLSCVLLIIYFFPPDAAGDGRWWLAYTVAVSKMSDTGAYFGGRLLGKRPLASYISPKKTIEGAIAGFLFAVLTSIALPFIAKGISGGHPLNLTLSASLFLGLAVALLSQLGDLAESLLKRDAKVKDSSQLPGLGGMLDMIDSLVFTLPLVYGYLRIITGV